MVRALFYLMICILTVVPAVVFGAGGHDGLTCTGCHALHTAKDSKLIFAVEANKKDVNPKTKQPYGGTTGLCLGCHEEPNKGGQGIKPIAGHLSHPFGLSSINAKIARVPAELVREGRFECIGCHDPHPSNANYKYLRVDTGANGAKMDVFCALCHPMKTDPKSAASKKEIFDSMDEGKYGSSSKAAR